VLFTRALARRLEGSGVTVNCLHPGVVATNIIPRNSRLLTWGAPLAKRFMLTPERGARTTLELALGPLGGKESGGYFDEHGVRREPSLVARDDALAERLWLRSAELVGLPA
jgi:NAD(P)-dependent dehydrogenase (short-subunit alcohol dehydrogenase family)